MPDPAVVPPSPASPAPVDPAARRRLWLLLTLAAVLGFLAATPYLLPLYRAAVAQAAAAGRRTPPLPVIVLAQLLQNALLCALAAWAGSRTAPVTGLDAPFFRALAERRAPGRRLAAELPLALLVGTALSVAILLINHFAGPALPDELRRHPPPTMAAGERAVAMLVGASSSFQGGINEELLMRWGVLALLAAGLAKAGARGAGAFWTANLMATLLYGAGHLPAAFKLGVPIGPSVVAYLVGANALAGLAFGWLFKKRGLEAAMLSHAWGDVCLHALPLAIG